MMKDNREAINSDELNHVNGGGAIYGEKGTSEDKLPVKKSLPWSPSSIDAPDVDAIFPSN